MIFRSIVFVLAAFLLNFVWESWHAVYLYQEGFGISFETRGNSLQQFVHLMTYVAGMDALFLSGILLGGGVAWRSWGWFYSMNFRKYMYFILAALLVAVVIEYKAIFLLHQWSYSDRMPTILGLGLSPLAQLAVTGLVSLWIARR
jgi:hypothetical protein